MISILNDIPLFRALSITRASAENEALQARSRFELTHDPAKMGGPFLIDAPHEGSMRVTITNADRCVRRRTGCPPVGQSLVRAALNRCRSAIDMALISDR